MLTWINFQFLYFTLTFYFILSQINHVVGQLSNSEIWVQLNYPLFRLNRTQNWSNGSNVFCNFSKRDDHPSLDSAYRTNSILDLLSNWKVKMVAPTTFQNEQINSQYNLTRYENIGAKILWHLETIWSMTVIYYT